jgi:hypothetical protein
MLVAKEPEFDNQGWPERSSPSMGRKGPNKKIRLEGTLDVKYIATFYKPPEAKGQTKYVLKDNEFFYLGQLHTFQIALIHEMINADYKSLDVGPPDEKKLPQFVQTYETWCNK